MLCNATGGGVYESPLVSVAKVDFLMLLALWWGIVVVKIVGGKCHVTLERPRKMNIVLLKLFV